MEYSSVLLYVQNHTADCFTTPLGLSFGAISSPMVGLSQAAMRCSKGHTEGDEERIETFLFECKTMLNMRGNRRRYGERTECRMYWT